MHRYEFLSKKSIYEALNKLRLAFLAAKNAKEVDEIILSILTHDERMKVGRRIQIAQMLARGHTYADIREALKVGAPTIKLVSKMMGLHPTGFKLVDQREKKTEKTIKKMSYEKTGSSKLIHKKRKYKGIRKEDISR